MITIIDKVITGGRFIAQDGDNDIVKNLLLTSGRLAPTDEERLGR